MSAAHIRRVIDNIGKARLVHDKPYAIQNLLEACNQVWKAESRAEAGKLDWLELIGWMWDKTRVKWTKKEAKGFESMDRRNMCRASLQDEAGVSKHLRAKGCRRSQEAVPKPVR